MLPLLTKPINTLVGVLYPVYQSFKALKSPEPEDDRQWLMYWMVYGLTDTASRWLDTIGLGLPGWSLWSIPFYLWLQLPMTRGASWLYRTCIEPWFSEHENVIDGKIEHFSRLSQDVIRAAKERIGSVVRDSLAVAASEVHKGGSPESLPEVDAPREIHRSPDSFSSVPEESERKEAPSGYASSST